MYSADDIDILGNLILKSIMALLISLPIFITIINLLRIIKKKKLTKFQMISNIIGLIICFLYSYEGYSVYDAYDTRGGRIYLDYTINTTIEKHFSTAGDPVYHAPIASWSMPTVITIIGIGIISYLILRLNKKKLPPLLIVILLSNTIICSIFFILFIVQVVFAHAYIHDILLVVFPINYILSTIKLQIDVVKEYRNNHRIDKTFDNKFLNKIFNIINNSDKMPIIALIMVIPILTIMICILCLFGQRPDEIIQAFFETSDWNLSKFVSPQIPVEYYGHYLCTVSLKGHKQIVKPTRVGIRYGNKIVVNRQLCIANAFEDLIKERTPRFHHFIRKIYDKYGYPLSKHINKSWQADFIYIFMKPLEWLFLVVLYLFDVNPENRIAVQYIGDNKII